MGASQIEGAGCVERSSGDVIPLFDDRRRPFTEAEWRELHEMLAFFRKVRPQIEAISEHCPGCRYALLQLLERGAGS